MGNVMGKYVVPEDKICFSGKGVKICQLLCTDCSPWFQQKRVIAINSTERINFIFLINFYIKEKTFFKKFLTVHGSFRIILF